MNSVAEYTRPDAGMFENVSEVIAVPRAIEKIFPRAQFKFVVAAAVIDTADSVYAVPSVVEPLTVSDDSVPTDVNDEVTTFAASVVPVKEPASPVPAVAHVPSPRRYVVEFAVPDPRRAVPTVPEDRFDAFSVVKFAPETAPNRPDQVPVVIVPTDVNDEVTMFEASEVPVRALPALVPPATDAHDTVLPFEVKYIPLAAACDGRIAFAAPDCVVAPVPPFARARIPESVKVPDVEIGPPENERPVEPPAA